MQIKETFQTLDDLMMVAAMPDPDKYPLTSRSVERRIEGGNDFECLACGGLLKFIATKKETQVIANVYDEKDVWRALVTFHRSCYDAVGAPFGEPAQSAVKQQQMRQA